MSWLGSGKDGTRRSGIITVLDVGSSKVCCIIARLKPQVTIAQAKSDYPQVVQYHVPAPGDEVPDFALLNQSDRKIDLKRYHGKVLLMTFIYTRCLLADYCPEVQVIDRCSSAKKALETSRKTINEVMYDVGYNDVKAFREVFKKITGMSPLEYRSKYNKEAVS